MDVKRIFSAEQIEVPPELPLVLKEWTKEIIRFSPEDPISFSAEYFAQKVKENQGKISEETYAQMKGAFAKYDNGSDQMKSSDFSTYILEATGRSMTDEECAKVTDLLSADGLIEFEDIVNWWAGQQ